MPCKRHRPGEGNPRVGSPRTLAKLGTLLRQATTDLYNKHTFRAADICAQNVCLLGLPSDVAASGWNRNLAARYSQTASRAAG